MKNHALILALTILSGCGCETVDTGRRGIKTRYGAIQGDPLPEGLYWYNPFTTSIKELSVQEVKLEEKTTCFTKDTQQVVLDFAITYSPDTTKIGVLYQKYGTDWAEKIVKPVVVGSLKDVVGRFIADDLVGKRESVRKDAFDEIRRTLAERNVSATRLDLTNLDFDDAYEKAVEAKVVAVQRAAEAKNKTVEVEEKAHQQVIAAEAEARSMTIRSEALSKNKGLVDWEAVQKWNGVLPTQMFGHAIPFININKDK